MGNVWAVLGWFAHGHLAEFSLQGGTKLAHAEERLNPIFDYSFRSHVCPWPSTRAAGHFWNEESISHVWRIEFGIYPHSPIADYQDLRRFKEVRAIWMFTSMLSWHVQAPCGCFKLPIGPIMILLQNGLVYYGDLAVGLDPWLNKKNRRCHDYLGYGSISKKNAQKKQIFWSFRVWTIQFRSILHNLCQFWPIPISALGLPHGYAWWCSQYSLLSYMYLPLIDVVGCGLPMYATSMVCVFFLYQNCWLNPFLHAYFTYIGPPLIW